jgi:LmbE family N-acetylglucosaminyl deacetylase
MVDHEMTSRLARAACFNAPIPNYLADKKLTLMPHIPHLYYCDPVEGKDPLGQEIAPGFCIDISKVIDTKSRMLACHASQRNWLLKHHGMDQYLESMKEWSGKRGKLVGAAYAEGFRQHLGHSYPQDNLLRELLG